MYMFEISHLLNHLGAIQWVTAVVFVPIVCWQFCATQTLLCRWCALASGYAVQIGFFLLLDDVGIESNLLILIASIAAYFWITTTVALWPATRTRTETAQTPAAEPEASA